MNTRFPIVVILLGICVPGVRIPIRATADELTASDKPTLDQVKTSGAVRSSYRDVIPQATNDAPPQANLKAFRAEIEPMLKIASYE